MESGPLFIRCYFPIFVYLPKIIEKAAKSVKSHSFAAFFIQEIISCAVVFNGVLFK